MVFLLVWNLFFYLFKFLVGVQTQSQEAWCPADAEDCHFKVTVDYGLTMMSGKDLVKAKNGKLYRYNTTDFTNTSFHAKEDIVTADGFFEPRLVMTYNGTIPGPTLHVHQGQRVHLRVLNHMTQETTTVHIHGVSQRRTPYSDGVPFVTQCPILPGQLFTQVFYAWQEGTFFYHAHSGEQRTNGLYGAFIVHPVQREDGKPGKKKRKIREHILMLQDWNHDWDSKLAAMKMRWGFYDKGKKIEATRSHAGIKYSPFPFQSGLINGKGRYYDTNGSHNEAPLSVFTVTPGKSYRFRFINAGNIHPFRISIDSHELKVVAADGIKIQSKLVESVIVNPGERFDAIVETEQPVGNYWIRGQTLQAGLNNSAEALLHYEGALKDEEPTPRPKKCISSDPCVVLNCPFLHYPEGSHTHCFNFDQIRSAKPLNLDLQAQGDNRMKEHFLNFGFPGVNERPGSVNGKSFVNQPVAALAQPLMSTRTCSRDNCRDDEICHCQYSITLKHNDLIQMVFLNMGSGQGWDHPVHMHGHSFQVIKMGYPIYDKSTGTFLEQNKDIDCGGGKNSFCNNATWTNSSWSNGNLPHDRTLFAPLKDTILVPSGGYVVVRFRADNPGLWLIHCHLELHVSVGMSAVLNESFPQWPKPPPDFSECHNYYG